MGKNKWFKKSEILNVCVCNTRHINTQHIDTHTQKRNNCSKFEIETVVKCRNKYVWPTDEITVTKGVNYHHHQLSVLYQEIGMFYVKVKDVWMVNNDRP